VTGRREDGSIPNFPVYDSTRTLVLLMSVGALPRVIERLVSECQFPDNVPVAVVERATWEDERVVRTTVGDAVEDVRKAGVSAHATIVVGGVVNALS
jgi:uroporphyrin-III C-methyltransferase